MTDPRYPISNVKNVESVAQASLVGPFRLRLASGQEITPKSPLRQAILAILIVAPNQTRPRNSLQAMFWGAADAERASSNLRQAIYLLKQDLAPLGPDTLRSDRQTISLLPSCIQYDKAAAGGADFLEGIDLALEDCELFEDWLRTMRAEAEERAPPKVPAKAGFTDPETYALGLLPSLPASASRSDLVRIESIIDSIALAVTQTTLLKVHDLRGYDVQAVPLPIESGKGATHFMQAVVERRDKKLILHLRLQDTRTRRLIWVSEPVDILTAELEDFVATITETLLDQITRSDCKDAAPDMFPWTALSALFSFDASLIERTEAQILRMTHEGGPPVLECLRVFAQVFKANEGIATADQFTAITLCETLAAIPSSHPMLPLCESLIGYSAHMLIGENELAATLVEDAFKRAPNLSLNLDHLAVIRMVHGDLSAAEAALERCLRTGVSSPWKHTYDVTGAMISMAKGDYRRSLSFANRALFRKPRFIGALRYAMVGFAMSENAREAQRMQAQIWHLRPQYDFSEWTEGMMRRTQPLLGATLGQSLQRNGLL